MARKKQDDCYTLTDLTTKEVKTIVEEFDLCARFLKHGLPDGNYNITGPKINLDLFKHQGIVYPAGGEVGGKNFPRRSLKECQEVFTDADFGWPIPSGDN